jgi:hypothetical protein
MSLVHFYIETNSRPAIFLTEFWSKISVLRQLTNDCANWPKNKREFQNQVMGPQKGKNPTMWAVGYVSTTKGAGQKRSRDRQKTWLRCAPRLLVAVNPPYVDARHKNYNKPRQINNRITKHYNKYEFKYTCQYYEDGSEVQFRPWMIPMGLPSASLAIR